MMERKEGRRETGGEVHANLHQRTSTTKFIHLGHAHAEYGNRLAKYRSRRQ